MPAAERPPEGTGKHEGVEARLAALERIVGALGVEVRTRRMVVVDSGGNERIVGEVSHDTTELRLELPGSEPGARSALVLFATPVAAEPDPEEIGLGPAIGIQLWAEGDAVTEIDAWPDDDGRWRPHLHLSGET